jgi:hypothetical protein
MSSPDPAFWCERVRQTLACYDEALLRLVAGKLVRPRGQWPAEELIDRCVHAQGNAAVIDRRLSDLDDAGRRLLAAIAHSRQPRWRLGRLIELLAALGHAEGPQPVFRLFESGLLYPELGPCKSLKGFEQWLGQGAGTGFMVFAHPQVLARALGDDFGLPELRSSCSVAHSASVHEADGLEWVLRLAAVWQQLADAPARLTQAGDFFKRDLDRFRADPLLNGPPADQLHEVPDAGLLAVVLGREVGIVNLDQTELRAGLLPADWDAGLLPTVASIWEALPALDAWNPKDGWQPGAADASPYPSAYLLLFLLLSRLSADGWARPSDLQGWIDEHHPFWQGTARPSRRATSSAAKGTQKEKEDGWVVAFLLGFAYQLRFLQAAQDSTGAWVVRLSPTGRWLLGQGDPPPTPSTYPQTLLVQPNLEVIVYRPGLTPGLIAELSRFATWKTLGSACTLQLEASRVYRGLEAGLSLDAIVQTLQQRGMRETPPAVVESLRTWAGKRERISVYPSATLFEFGNPEDLNEALARGLSGVRLAPNLLLVAGQDVDFRHFRLVGTRDYALPPDRCVAVEPDGVTLAVDLTRSDLLLETELPRFAEPVELAAANGYRRYRLTPGSLAAGRESGLGARELEGWFLQRAGQPLSAAARLLLERLVTPLELRTQLVLHVPAPEVADGLLQWPGTRALIRQRLGPTALIVDEEQVATLRERLREMGLELHRSEP